MSGPRPAPEGPSRAAVTAAIERLVAARPPLLVIADFDGTLAVGARDPAIAHIEPAAQRALRHLARLADAYPGRLHVIVLTGRTVADVADRVRVGGLELHGDHGLQHAAVPRGGRVAAIRPSDDPRFDRHRDPAEVLAAGVPEELGRPPWLFVERKGPSVAFHVRQADDVVAARAAVVRAIAAVEARAGIHDHGLAHYRGRSVVDLRPVEAGGKREAVERLIARHDAGGAVALGDELSDVDALAAVADAQSRRRGFIGIGVAVHGDGRSAPDELREVADLELPSARAVGPFLARLARAIERATG